ncbi:2-methylene-furan-3-one reductase [Tanacetum coccineum]
MIIRSKKNLTVESEMIVILLGAGQGEKAAKVVKEGGNVVVLTGAVTPPRFRFVVTSTGSTLRKLNQYLVSGKMKAVIDPNSLFPFDRVEESFSYLETNRATRKVNVFMWRLSLDRLPHRLNLSSRGMDIPAISCPSCNTNVESANHIFFECDITF